MDNIKQNVNAARDKVATVIKPSILIYEFAGIALQVYAFSFGVPIIRGLAYFMGWILSYHISGAEFNPATTVGRFFAIKDYANWRAVLYTIFIHYVGSLFGIFMLFIILEEVGQQY